MTRTVDDWLRDATAAGADAASVVPALQAAMAGAQRCYEWRSIVSGLGKLAAVPRELIVEIADRTLVAALAEREVWGVRDVAQLRAQQLDDRSGARGALDAGIGMLVAEQAELDGSPPYVRHRTLRAYRWVMLGEGFLATLGDAGELRRCVEIARDRARADRDGDDLVAVAAAYIKYLARDDGVALLAEADALVDNGSVRPWTLANAWSAAGDPDGVRRVLDRALAATTSVADAIHVTRAWACHHDDAATRAAFARAEALATSSEEWLALGELAFDTGLGTDAIRRTLERAEAVLGAVEDTGDRRVDWRERVAAGYKVWLGDDAAAARVGPRGIRPEEMRPRVRELAGHDASASALFDWLRARATPAILAAIAGADYGMDYDKHLGALSDLCETGLVPRELAWEPQEVLHLTRWTTGERTDHLARALCCVVLCISPGDMDDLATNGIVLLDSCFALGAEALDLAARFFAWCAETIEDDDVDYAVALLLLVLDYAARADTRATEMADRLLAVDPGLRVRLGSNVASTLRGELWVQRIAALDAPFESVAALVKRGR